MRRASEAIVPLLGSHDHGQGTFSYDDLKMAFRDCQWVEEDAAKNVQFGIGDGSKLSKRALWFRKGVSLAPEYRQRKIRTTVGGS